MSYTVMQDYCVGVVFHSFIVKMCMCRYNTGAGRGRCSDDITVEMGELHSEKPAFAVEVCIIIV